MESHGAGDGASRSDSRERRSDSQHPRGRSKKDSRQKSNSGSRGSGNNWQRYENTSRPNFASYSDSSRPDRTDRPDVRLKIPSLRCEGIPTSNKRQNRSVKAECFVSLVYEDDRSIRRERPKTSNRKANILSNRRTVYTTENYMQANCQFVVDSHCSALVAKLREDPDFAPPWETICEVRLLASSEPNCPICMNKPIARRITTCGHLFCLPCLIHYFTINAEKMVPCPICFTKIDISSMKPVSLVHCIEYSVGDTISFALSRCRKGTTLVELVDADSTAMRLSNVVFASKFDMISRLEADKDQLTKLLPTNPDSGDAEEATFVVEAIKLLQDEVMQAEACEIEAQNNSLEMLGVSPPKPNNIVFYVDAFADHKADSMQGEYSSSETSAPNEKARQESPPAAAASINQSAIAGHSKPGEVDNSYYYFYQSIDGQRIYLNSFNVRCLQKQFGHLGRCPSVLEGKILGIEYVSVTAEIRSQFRYLSHLPLYSHFQSAEVDLSSALSEETMQQFASEIERRKSERALKQTKEDAYSRRAETLMERITEKASGVSPIVLDEPLIYDHAAFLADSPSLFSVDSNNEGNSNSSNNPDSPNNNVVATTWPASSSFAKILTEGRPLDNDFPTLGSPPSIPPSPAAIMSAAPISSRTASRIAHQNHVNALPSQFAKVKYGKTSSAVPATAAAAAVIAEPKKSLTAEEEEELAYAVPEAPRTLADCLSNLNLAQPSQPDSPSSGAGWKKSKKKSEARLLFSSGRGHALLN